MPQSCVGTMGKAVWHSPAKPNIKWAKDRGVGNRQHLRPSPGDKPRVPLISKAVPWFFRLHRRRSSEQDRTDFPGGCLRTASSGTTFQRLHHVAWKRPFRNGEFLRQASFDILLVEFASASDTPTNSRSRTPTTPAPVGRPRPPAGGSESGRLRQHGRRKASFSQSRDRTLQVAVAAPPRLPLARRTRPRHAPRSSVKPAARPPLPPARPFADGNPIGASAAVRGGSSRSRPPVRPLHRSPTATPGRASWNSGLSMKAPAEELARRPSTTAPQPLLRRTLPPLPPPPLRLAHLGRPP